jgi:hypothetical protein
MSNVDEEEFDFDYEDDFDVWRKSMDLILTKKNKEIDSWSILCV